MVNTLFKKGHKFPPEVLKKIGKSIHEKYKNGYVNPFKGKKHTVECRKRMSKAKKGKPTGISYWKGKKMPREMVLKRSGKNNVLWKGDNVGYDALHDWVRTNLGHPKECEHCGRDNLTNTVKKRTINWANKSGEYRRELSDWFRLCTKCHHKHDSVLRVNKKKLWTRTQK